VHRLRNICPTHRGIRPGVLIAARAVVCSAVVLGALGMLAACAPRPSAARPGAAAAAWFQLQAGVFQPVAGPEASLAVAHRPWTVQSRVSDLAFMGQSLYSAINGSGLAVISLDAAGAPSFAYHADALIFAHRTITTLVPRQGSLAVHLYYNALLNEARPEELPIAGICLVSWLPGQSDFAFLIPPFQRKNPDWEAVGFAPESENSFDIEWKYTDAAETRFAYTRFHADTKEEESVSRDTYLAALGVPAITGPAVPSGLSDFFAACKAGIGSLSPDVSLQFSLRSMESPVRRNYRSRKESDAAVTIPVFEEQGTRYALLPDGRVLGEKTVSLPALPDGFRYTDLVKMGDSLVVPWEETSFTDVGRAGIMFFRLSP
jgi:hypothetical protein